MSRKTTTLYILDAGINMGETISISDHDIPCRKFDIAKSTIIFHMTHKISSSKVFEAGLCLFGRGKTDNSISTDTTYQNVEEFLSVGRTTLAQMKDINSIQIGETSGDLIDGLVVGINQLKNHQAGKSMNRG